MGVTHTMATAGVLSIIFFQLSERRNDSKSGGVWEHFFSVDFESTHWALLSHLAEIAAMDSVLYSSPYRHLRSLNLTPINAITGLSPKMRRSINKVRPRHRFSEFLRFDHIGSEERGSARCYFSQKS